MLIYILLNLVPYCEPMKDEKQFSGCLNYMYECTEIRKESEENCVESLPIEFYPL